MSEPITGQGKRILLEVIDGVEGQAVYLNSYRIAGPKPWGGGKIVKSWDIEIERIRAAMPSAQLRDPT